MHLAAMFGHGFGDCPHCGNPIAKTGSHHRDNSPHSTPVYLAAANILHLSEAKLQLSTDLQQAHSTFSLVFAAHCLLYHYLTVENVKSTRAYLDPYFRLTHCALTILYSLMTKKALPKNIRKSFYLDNRQFSIMRS